MSAETRTGWTLRPGGSKGVYPGEAVPVVDARLTDELVEKVAKARWERQGGGHWSRPWCDIDPVRRATMRRQIRDDLLAAGFEEVGDEH